LMILNIVCVVRVSSLYPVVPPTEPTEAPIGILMTRDLPKEGLSAAQKIVEPWRHFFSQGAALMSLGYTFLFFTYIGPGAFLINYLASIEVPNYQIGIFHAVASVFGFIASFFTPAIMSKLGASKAGMVAIYLYLGVAGSALTFIFFPTGTELFTWLFLGSLILARVPLWMFDAIEVSIVKTSISEVDKIKFKGAEATLSNVFLLLSFAFWLSISFPSNFKWLALASVLAIFVCVIFYTIWYMKYGDAQEKPNSVLGGEIQGEFLENGDDIKLSEDISSSD